MFKRLIGLGLAVMLALTTLGLAPPSHAAAQEVGECELSTNLKNEDTRDIQFRWHDPRPARLIMRHWSSADGYRAHWTLRGRLGWPWGVFLPIDKTAPVIKVRVGARYTYCSDAGVPTLTPVYWLGPARYVNMATGAVTAEPPRLD